jgi:EpsI family protein
MIARSRRQFVLGSALLGLAGLGALARPPRPPGRPGLQRELEAGLPDRVGNYARRTAAGVVLPRQDELSRQIYDGFVAHAYVAPGLAPIFLVVAYGSVQDYALQLHRPEYCYPASGYTIGDLAHDDLHLPGRTIRSSRMEASLARRIDSVLWWTRIGNDFPVTVWEERGEILAAALRREVPDGVLVRLSTAASPGSVATLEAFASDMMGNVAPAIRRLLIGSAT